MTNWRSLQEKDFIGSWDLVDAVGKPKDFTLKIATVTSRAVNSRETPKGKRKVVITFHGAKKAMIANTTNCETIESMFGPEIEKWVGESITLYQTMVRSPKGGQIAGVRVRPKKPTGAAEILAEREVDPEIRKAQDEAFDRGDSADEY